MRRKRNEPEHPKNNQLTPVLQDVLPTTQQQFRLGHTARFAAGRRLTERRRGSAAGHVATKLFRSQAHSVSSAVAAAAHEADGALDADADPAVCCLLLKRALFVLFNSGLCSSDSVPPTSGLVASPAS